MAFQFSLATLLRLREIAEEREERMLGQILQQIAQSQQTLVELESRRQRLFQMREEAMQQKASGIEITSFYQQVSGVEELQRSGREQLLKLEKLRVQQMKTYEAAHRNRELLAGMREEQMERYQVERGRQEQSMMDDNFSARRLSGGAMDRAG